MPELPDAKKWFTGFFDITRWIKDGGILLRIIGILGIGYLLYIGGTALWRRVVPPKPQPHVAEVVNCPGGNCDISSGEKKTTKIGFITW